jgi:hypothetical protein
LDKISPVGGENNFPFLSYITTRENESGVKGKRTGKKELKAWKKGKKLP